MAERTKQLLSCPTGTYCSDHEHVCVSNCKGSISCLNVCKKCDQTPGNKFACVNETSYSICSGNIMNDEILTCDDGYICDVNNENMCSDENLVEPQCIGNFEDLPISDFTPTPTPVDTTIKTTTPNIILDQDDINDFCQSSPDETYITFDPTCKSYIICRNAENGKRDGLQTSCVYYFNKDVPGCQKDKPAHCQ